MATYGGKSGGHVSWPGDIIEGVGEKGEVFNGIVIGVVEEKVQVVTLPDGVIEVLAKNCQRLHDGGMDDEFVDAIKNPPKEEKVAKTGKGPKIAQ